MNVTNDANSDGTSPNDSSKFICLSRQFQKKNKKNKTKILSKSCNSIIQNFKLRRRNN